MKRSLSDFIRNLIAPQKDMINFAKQAHEYRIKTLEEMNNFQQLN